MKEAPWPRALQPYSSMTLPPRYLVEIILLNHPLTANRLVLQVDGQNLSLVAGYKVIIIAVLASALVVNNTAAGVYKEGYYSAFL